MDFLSTYFIILLPPARSLWSFLQVFDWINKLHDYSGSMRSSIYVSIQYSDGIKCHKKWIRMHQTHTQIYLKRRRKIWRTTTCFWLCYNTPPSQCLTRIQKEYGMYVSFGLERRKHGWFERELLIMNQKWPCPHRTVSVVVHIIHQQPVVRAILVTDKHTHIYMSHSLYVCVYVLILTHCNNAPKKVMF